MAASPEQARINGMKGGRPKGKTSIASEKARALVVAAVTKNLKPLLDAKMALALGHKVLKDKDTVYTVSPDGNAIQYLLNQTIGKPKETLDVTEDVTLKLDV